MQCLDDFRLSFKGRDFLPLMVGGMGTNISTANLVLAIEKLGGMAHLSDAMLPDVADREIGTHFTKEKTIRFKSMIEEADKTEEKFNLEALSRVSKQYFSDVMEKATGKGLVLVNCMEKLTMNDPIATLRARLNAALDAGVDGITMSAGLHLSSLKLMQDNPRFNDALFGLVVSSARALNLFMKRTAFIGRKLDYVVVEGPLAGGHLGFGEDWRNFKLEDIVKDVVKLVKDTGLNVPVLGAGGIFSGKEAVDLMKKTGASGIQAATRFTIAQESGLPDPVKQVYIDAKDEDVEVNHASPTGYLMRMLKNSPALTANNRPNCESYGYMLHTLKSGWKTRPRRPNAACARICAITKCGRAVRALAGSRRQRLEVKTGSGFFRRPNKSSTTIDWPKQIDNQERGAKVSSASFAR